MKKSHYGFITLAAIGLAVLLTGDGADAAVSVLNYFASPASGSKDNELTIGGTWSIGGTDVTASAAEINYVDGVPSTLDFYTATLSSDMDVGANACKSSAAQTMTGAAVGDPCTIGPDATSAATNVEISCYVSATDAAKVKLCNYTGSIINLNGAEFTLRAWDQ